MPKITHITASEILDSRGTPTVQAVVTLDNGQIAAAAVASGASRGTHEAVELRDNDPKRYLGQGVLTAIDHIQNTIAPELIGMEITRQEEIDRKMIELDGTENKSKLGANSILAVSLAVCRAAAAAAGKRLYEHIAHLYGSELRNIIPAPMFNVVNGGLHGSGSFNFQEFLIIPNQKYAFADALRVGAELYQELKKLLIRKNLIHSVGDEGGFTPNLETNKHVLETLKEVIETSSYLFNEDVFLALDLAASTFYHDSLYEVDKGKKKLSQDEYTRYIKDVTNEFHLISLEDPLPEDEWESWITLTKECGENTMIVGDDLLVTNPKRLQTAIEKKACNAILVKVNQIGTLTETLEVIREARKAGFEIIISHRSGETVDHFIADLAVGVGADFVKFGAPSRGERVVKYNRLLAIFYETSRSYCS